MSLANGVQIPSSLSDPASPTIPGTQPPGYTYNPDGTTQDNFGNPNWRPPTGAAPTVGNMPQMSGGYNPAGGGNTQNLGGVFGQRASPYLGALLQGIFGGANFQQAQQAPRYLSGGFNPQEYLAANPDVAAEVQSGQMPSALAHYMRWGMNEGRAPNARANGAGPNYLGSTLLGRFNEMNYLNANPDVAAAVRSGAMPSAAYHYKNFGLKEGRSPYGWGPSTGAQSQWMPPRTAPPGTTPTSSVPGVQYAQAPPPPAPAAAAPAIDTAAMQQNALAAQYFPDWNSGFSYYSG